MKPRILVVDDEQTIQDTLRWRFEDQGFAVATVSTGEEAVRLLETQPFDVIVSDIILPGMSGLDVLQRVRAVDPEVAVILITAYSTVETAVEALRQGANDYVLKPFRMDDIAFRVQRLLPSTAPAAEGRTDPGGGILVGQSPALKAVRAQIARLAATSSHTLITGESGTGKELVARAIHAASRRRKHRFVPVNCGAIPETLFESHLFGHVRGAFTNAVHAHPGLFALAHQGTLFLDEVGELSLALQVKLLRVLEAKEVWALGDTKPTFVDTRIVASTNRDLRRDVEGSRFREDLFYRLNVARVDLPPLRERREDIPLLVEHFIGRLNTKLGRRVVAIEPAALQVLAEHDWPGNVRELEHVLESAMIAADGELISVGLLRPEIVRRPPASLRDAIRRFERQQILQVLNLTHFDKKEAARRLGLSLASLYRKLEGNAT